MVAANAHRISLADASALNLALTLNATLLTGDGYLRKVAAARTVKVCGVLGILERMVEAGSLSGSQAIAALNRILAAGAFLPAGECEALMKTWSP